MFEFTDPSLQGEVNLGLLDLKLQEEHLAILQSQACEADKNLSVNCTKCSFNPSVKKR